MYDSGGRRAPRQLGVLSVVVRKQLAGTGLTEINEIQALLAQW